MDQIRRWYDAPMGMPNASRSQPDRDRFGRFHLMPSDSQTDVYESAIDWWIAALLFLAPAIATTVGIYLFIEGRPAESSMMLVTAAATMLVTAAFTLPCRYTLLEDALMVRCGLIRYRIPYAKIRAVEPSASLRSGPALSLRRVAVITDRQKHILSPKQRDEFIGHLQQQIESRHGEPKPAEST